MVVLCLVMGSRGWRLRRVNWRAVDLTRALALPNARCATSPQRIQAALGQRGSCVCSGAELGRMREEIAKWGRNSRGLGQLPSASGRKPSTHCQPQKAQAVRHLLCVLTRPNTRNGSEGNPCFLYGCGPANLRFTRNQISAVGFGHNHGVSRSTAFRGPRDIRLVNHNKASTSTADGFVSPHNFALNA